MPQDPNHQETILRLLKNLQGIEPLRELFWTELNYDRQNDQISRWDWADTAKNALAEDPVLFATGGTGDAFHVIYARLQRRPLAVDSRTACHLSSLTRPSLHPVRF